MKKYKITKETKVLDNGKKVYRIKALRNFSTSHSASVSAGEYGGWVENKKNLSQEGNCWIGGNACVTDNAQVTENAYVGLTANISGNAKVSGSALVFGDVSENAIVSDKAQINSQSVIKGNAGVYGSVRIVDSTISGDACIGKFVSSAKIAIPHTISAQEILCKEDYEAYPIRFGPVTGFLLVFTKEGVTFNNSPKFSEEEIVHFVAGKNERLILEKNKSKYNSIDCVMYYLTKNTLPDIAKQCASYFVKEVLDNCSDSFRTVYRYIFSRLINVMNAYELLSQYFDNVGVQSSHRTESLDRALLPWCVFVEALIEAASLDLSSGEILDCENAVMVNSELVDLITRNKSPEISKKIRENIDHCCNSIPLP